MHLFIRMFLVLLGLLIAGSIATLGFPDLFRRGQLNFQNSLVWFLLLIFFIGCLMIYAGISKKSRVVADGDPMGI